MNQPNSGKAILLTLLFFMSTFAAGEQLGNPQQIGPGEDPLEWEPEVPARSNQLTDWPSFQGGNQHQGFREAESTSNKSLIYQRTLKENGIIISETSSGFDMRDFI